jgi:hypothetical protein
MFFQEYSMKQKEALSCFLKSKLVVPANGMPGKAFTDKERPFALCKSKDWLPPNDLWIERSSNAAGSRYLQSDSIAIADGSPCIQVPENIKSSMSP